MKLSFLFYWIFSLLVLGRGDEEAVKKAVYSAEELATKDGQSSSELWLSFLGKIYDVSAGASFYGPGSTYNAFVAKDATRSYLTGIFTPEEASKSVFDLEISKLKDIKDWTKFYSESDTYKFVGYLEGDYYTAEGEPTPALEKLLSDIDSGKDEL